MTKLFNASLVALAVAGSLSVNAATLTPVDAATGQADVIKLSTEAVEVGLTSTGNLVFDTIVTKDHSAGAEIVLSFSDKVDLSAVTSGACNAPTTGTFTCGSLDFNVGTGSFTFDAVDVDDVAKTISFNVNLGNPLVANSAFRTTIKNIVIGGASNIDYASNLGGAEIETGSAVIATEASQYAFSVATQYNNRVERVNQDTFATFGASEDKNTDIAVVNLLDNAADFDVAAETVGSDIQVNANLFQGDAVVADFTITNPTAGFAATAPAAVTSTGGDLIGFTSTLTDFGSNATTFTFVSPDGDVIPLTAVSIDAEVSYADNAGTPTKTGDKTLAQAADLGQWELDASVVNVPYLPVGFESLSSNVEYSNHGSSAAEVSISAFDNNGNEYTGTLANAAPKTVTKYSEADIMGALGITEATKLNITFISDADEENVSIVPYYRQGDSRVQSINDQYKK
ncbi:MULTISPECIES: hypothetical protein [Vibrio]|uniref:hypothetical protein n=1 Tax=Vibrio TaxID=662 RepID=UPI001A8DCC0E|nr:MULTISPECIES: hypothetical protein [Vibrio]MBO0198034.1 hypothetical protein [Vibrio alginolyticus]MCR9641835.1 hypothetical protein [Vibrio alginolyticus]MDW1579726.1 hypothetical protein [Vibrio sp. Vb2897]MDW1585881.1 hypothetical protein [Vibrio sp. Vb2910]MDW1594822.1 hypothetical protein [Vibrio sp. Vb2911]